MTGRVAGGLCLAFCITRSLCSRLSLGVAGCLCLGICLAPRLCLRDGVGSSATGGLGLRRSIAGSLCDRIRGCVARGLTWCLCKGIAGRATRSLCLGCGIASRL